MLLISMSWISQDDTGGNLHINFKYLLVKLLIYDMTELYIESFFASSWLSYFYSRDS